MTIFTSDIGQLPSLPEDWLGRVMALVETHAYSRAFDDRAPTAREKLRNGEVVKSWVVDGDQIANNEAWLIDLYRSDLLALAGRLTGREVEIGRDQTSNINVNMISGRGNRFEKHVDTNHLTGLLFATTLSEDEGGALCFETDEGVKRIQPEIGKIVFADARKLPHYVTALTGENQRIVIVMNFFFADEPYDRPEEINTYIYGTKS